MHSLTVLCVCVVQWEKQMVRSANFITIQGLTPNKTYYIRVLAFTSVGDGPLSQDLQIIAKTGGNFRFCNLDRCIILFYMEMFQPSTEFLLILVNPVIL